MLEWIDSHTHLESEYPFSTDIVVENAKSNGVKTLITIGNEPKTLQQLKNNAEKYNGVFFTVGVHPHEAKDFNTQIENEMASLKDHPKCVAVGEIGLDYYYNHSPKEIQKAAFHRQCELALEWNKPIVIHSRDAEESLLNELKWFAPQSKRKGVIHCFSGTQNFAEECLRLGFYISFSGIITFKNSEPIRNIAKTIPLDRILIETDAPFLAPVPFRGKTNQSSYLIETAKSLATTLGISLELLSESTVKNTKQLFNI